MQVVRQNAIRGDTHIVFVDIRTPFFVVVFKDRSVAPLGTGFALPPCGGRRF